jgi:hypothetical protein
VTVGRAGPPHFSLSHPDEQAENDVTTNITSAAAITWPREVRTSRMVDRSPLVSPISAALPVAVLTVDLSRGTGHSGAMLELWGQKG